MPKGKVSKGMKEAIARRLGNKKNIPTGYGMKKLENEPYDEGILNPGRNPKPEDRAYWNGPSSGRKVKNQ